MFDGAAASDPMPWSAIWILFVCMFVGGGVVAWVGWRSAAGQLDRNWLIGIRTSATLESDVAWDVAHRAAGSRMSVGGVAPMVAGFFLLSGPTNGVGAVVVLSALAWMLAWILAAGVTAQRAARSVD